MEKRYHALPINAPQDDAAKFTDAPQDEVEAAPASKTNMRIAAYALSIGCLDVLACARPWENGVIIAYGVLWVLWIVIAVLFGEKRNPLKFFQWGNKMKFASSWLLPLLLVLPVLVLVFGAVKFTNYGIFYQVCAGTHAGMAIAILTTIYDPSHQPSTEDIYNVWQDLPIAHVRVPYAYLWKDFPMQSKLYGSRWIFLALVLGLQVVLPIFVVLYFVLFGDALFHFGFAWPLGLLAYAIVAFPAFVALGTITQILLLLERHKRCFGQMASRTSEEQLFHDPEKWWRARRIVTDWMLVNYQITNLGCGLLVSLCLILTICAVMIRLFRQFFLVLAVVSFFMVFYVLKLLVSIVNLQQEQLKLLATVRQRLHMPVEGNQPPTYFSREEFIRWIDDTIRFLEKHDDFPNLFGFTITNSTVNLVISALLSAPFWSQVVDWVDAHFSKIWNR